jgi:hypothetical protein
VGARPKIYGRKSAVPASIDGAALLPQQCLGMDATAIALRTRLACRLRCQEIEHVPVTFDRQKEAHLIDCFNASAVSFSTSLTRSAAISLSQRGASPARSFTVNSGE